MSNRTHWGFAVRAIGEKPPEGIVSVKYAPIPADCRESLIDSYRRRLAGEPSQISGEIKIPGFPPTTVYFERIDRSAAVVQFVRTPTSPECKGPPKTLSAVAMLLTGIDPAADDQAIAQGKSLITTTNMRIDMQQLQRVLADTRPMAVFVAKNAASMMDPSMQVIFNAVAVAFFDQVGAHGPAEPGDGLPPFRVESY